LTFNWAWTLALEKYPPRSSDRIVPEPDANAPAMRLFDEQGQREESIVEAMRRFCEDAWNGQRPGVSGFSLTLLGESVDETSSVSAMSSFRLAA
jgi:hypothetical protein